MKYLDRLFILLFIIFINSCGQFNINEKAISINIDNLDKEAKEIQHLSELAYDFKLIPLEATKKSLISRIDHIKIVNDTIYILDGFSAKKLLLFSIDGKYINKISRIGKGPGEFLEPMDFDIDPVNHEIMIFDNASSKIIIYNTGGKYLRSIKLKDRITSFIYHDNNYYLFTDRKPGDNKFLHKMNSEGRYTWSGLDSEVFIEKKHGSLLKGGNFYKFNNKIIFWSDIHPIIYAIKNGRVSPLFILNTKKHLINEKNVEISTVNLFKSNMLHSIQEYSENIKYSLFNFSIGTRRIYLIYDKNNNYINYFYYGSHGRFKDDVSNLPPNYFQLLEDNRMVGIVPIFNIIRLDSERLKELNMDDKNYNPVIIIYDLDK